MRSGPELEGDGVDHLAVIPPTATPVRRPVREQRLDPRSLRVSQRHTRTIDRLCPAPPVPDWSPDQMMLSRRASRIHDGNSDSSLS
jgi:hypothetical protein